MEYVMLKGNLINASQVNFHLQKQFEAGDVVQGQNTCQSGMRPSVNLKFKMKYAFFQEINFRMTHMHTYTHTWLYMY